MTLVRIPKAQFSNASIPQAYRDEVTAASTVSADGNYMLLAPTILNSIKTKYGRPTKLPPITSTLANAAAAASRVAHAMLNGHLVLATDAVIAQRRAICQLCPELQDSRCLRCGCYYSVKIKIAGETCPAGKW